MVAALGVVVMSFQGVALPAITFADQPKVPYFILRDAVKIQKWTLNHDPVTGLTELNGQPVPVDQPRLFGGALLVHAPQIKPIFGKKRVLVDLTRQEISAWEGKLQVMHTRISSGRELKDTPPGTYKTGLKEKMHISSIYGSKMPFSVHLRGNYFIHGSEQTQSGPGSYGCIRLPLYNQAAQWFFGWVTPGTPVKVQGKRPKHRTKSVPGQAA
jgi:hypothetical protein